MHVCKSFWSTLGIKILLTTGFSNFSKNLVKSFENFMLYQLINLTFEACISPSEWGVEAEPKLNALFCLQKKKMKVFLKWQTAKMYENVYLKKLFDIFHEFRFLEYSSSIRLRCGILCSCHLIDILLLIFQEAS